MRAKACGAPRGASLAGQADVIINAVDSLHIRLAVTGTSCDKYPGKPRCPSAEETEEGPRKVHRFHLRSLSRPLIELAPLDCTGFPDR